MRRLFDYRISEDGVEAVCRALLSIPCTESRPAFFACANPHSLEVARTDALFHNALLAADILVPDGVGVVWALRLLGSRDIQRITGSDVFQALNSLLQREHSGGRVFFLGSSEATLKAVIGKFQIEYPNIVVSGSYSPPYRPEFSAEEQDEILRRIHAARPDVVWVSLTAPKQEKLIYRNLESFGPMVLCPIGAVFEFYAGITRRPSPLAQRLGIEWLVRLLGEPRRLWRRTVVSAPAFVLHFLVYAARRGVSSAP